jgi:hypothetical protein
MLGAWFEAAVMRGRETILILRSGPKDRVSKDATGHLPADLAFSNGLQKDDESAG